MTELAEGRARGGSTGGSDAAPSAAVWAAGAKGLPGSTLSRSEVRLEGVSFGSRSAG